MKKIALLFFVACLAACASPILIHYPATPHFYGRVVDKDTEKPIAGAVVSLKENPNKSATTDTDGYFDLSSVEKEFRQPYFGNLDLPSPSGVLSIQADGYRRLDTQRYTGEWASVLDFKLEKL